METVKKILIYLRELSVVVLGIAITLLANNRISNGHDNRDIDLYMDAVKAELEYNKEEAMTMESQYLDVRKSAHYLASERRDTLGDPSAYLWTVSSIFYTDFKRVLST